MNRRSYDLVKGRTGDGSCQWSSRSYSLDEITRSFSLPMVIKSDVRSAPVSPQDYRHKLTDQAMLLYETRTKNKMVATHLQYERQPVSQGDAKKIPRGEEKVILPEDYPGWFVYLKSVNGGVRCIERVSDLHTSKVKAFVTGSKVAGLQVTTLQEGKVEYKPRHFLPGTVFTADRIYVGKVRVDAGSKFLLFRKTKMQDVKYLKCRDVQNRDILLAIDKVGKFFEICPVLLQGNKTENYVFNTEDLFSLRQILSPVMLIYGQIPRVENFSGILHLQRKFVDKTVVAATNIDRNNHVVLEIAIASSSTYHLALNSKDVTKYGDMGGALKHCRRKADEFVQRIRVPFALSQEIAEETGDMDSKEMMEQEEIMSKKLHSITESIEEEEDVKTEDDNKNDIKNNYNEENDETTDKALLVENANESPVHTNEKENDLDDEKTELTSSSEPVKIIDDKTHNDIMNSIDESDNACSSDSEAHSDKEETVTITVEEKLINLNCMSAVTLSSTTTTTEVHQSQSDVKQKHSDNSEESDFDREKMTDSDTNDDADSGISEKNKANGDDIA